jgi:hypothetical protein
MFVSDLLIRDIFNFSNFGLSALNVLEFIERLHDLTLKYFQVLKFFNSIIIMYLYIIIYIFYILDLMYTYFIEIANFLTLYVDLNCDI